MGLVLWGRASSVNVQKALWALDEMQLSYHHEIVGGKYGGMEALEPLTPVPLVPVLEDGSVVVWESHAILRYLANRCGWSLDPNHLARAETWLEYGTGTLQPAFIGVFWQLVRTAPSKRDPEVSSARLNKLSASLSVLEQGLARSGNEFLAGTDFTIADVGVGSMMYRLFDIAPELASQCPNVVAWRDRLALRAGWQNHIATSYEELRATDP